MEHTYTPITNACMLNYAMESAPADEAEKELAILFLDLKNYTGLLQSQNTREVILMVKKLFGVFNRLIDNFKGKIIDRAGDSLYAVFGLQTGIREAVSDAFNAARMLMDTLKYFNSQFAEARYGHQLEMGIGLHAGQVVVEQPSAQNGQYLSVMGLPVNIASRLQTATRELNNNLLLSEEVFLLLDGQENQYEQRSVLLHGVNNRQNIRLAGQPFETGTNAITSGLDLDYLLAIAG